MVINLRGTSGSGKTYAVRQLMAHAGTVFPVYQGKKVIAHCAHLEMVPIYFLGSYENVCGGCDTIMSQDLVCSLVRHFCQFGHVVFEGLIVGHLFARYVALDREVRSWGIPYVWLLLDTPLEVCLDRVSRRRLERGDERPLNPQNTIDKYYQSAESVEKAKQAGLTTRILHHDQNLLEQWLALLSEDGAYDFANSYREESFRNRR